MPRARPVEAHASGYIRAEETRLWIPRARPVEAHAAGMPAGPGNSNVKLHRTSRWHLDDYRLPSVASYQRELPRDKPVAVKFKLTHYRFGASLAPPNSLR
jgi:hypothetical protein